MIESGIMPQFAVGDFDSITKEEKDYLAEKLAINPYHSEKDDTDLALGIDQAIHSGYSEICVYGATGGRLDHFMGALQILEKPEYTKRKLILKSLINKMKFHIYLLKIIVLKETSIIHIYHSSQLHILQLFH